MDRRKALKNVAFYSAPSPPLQLEFYLKVLHFPRMKKIKCFFQEQMKRAEFADIIIPTTKLSRS
jgi:hypothetical protein